jgi:hypothetical protein
MIIHYLHVVCITLSPFKANPPLLINPNTVLTFPIPRQFFQPIRWGYTQIIERNSSIEHSQFPQSHLLNIRWKFARTLAVEDFFGFF